MNNFLRKLLAPAARVLPPPPPLVLGLTAPAGSGKDTVAAYLEDRYAFTVVAFADPLIDMLHTLVQHVDVDGAWLTERALKETTLPVIGRSYRELAQSLGTGWGRELVYRDLWVRIAHHKLLQARERGENIVFTDVRFPNEAEWLSAQGGTLVRIHRQAANAVHPHESEQHTHHLHAHHVLANNSSLGALEHRVDALMEHLRQGAPA